MSQSHQRGQQAAREVSALDVAHGEARAPLLERDDRGEPTEVATGIDAKAYAKIMDLGILQPANGIYQKDSPYYTGTSYPKYNKAQAKKLAAAYKKKHGN